MSPLDFSFVIQEPVFDHRIDEMRDLLHEMGIDYYIYPKDSRGFDVHKPALISEGPTIVMASIFVCREFQKRGWYGPGIFFSEERFKFSSYAPLIGDHLLNQDFVMLPFGEVRRRWGSLKASHPGGIFIRPNSGSKSFSGVPIRPDMFDHEMNFLRQCIMDHELVCLSEVKPIKGEWRFWIVNDTVITYSYYKRMAGYDIQDIPAPDECYELAWKIAKCDNQPDTAYTLDICMSEGQPKVVEINAFSTSGVYLATLPSIVSAIIELYRKENCDDYIQNGSL